MDLKRICVVQKKQSAFWKEIVQQNVKLLTSEEAVDSDVTKEAAANFFEEAIDDAMDVEEPANQKANEVVDEEDPDFLLGQLQ